MTLCPCGSGTDFDACCRPYLAGTPAPTAEALMRSRYTAFVRGDMAHVERTFVREEREKFDLAETEEMFGGVEWQGLEIVDTSDGGPDDETGIVEFAARFKKDGAALVHRERSTFQREDGKWVYVDGDIDLKETPRRVQKVGRNEPCPCGSGKKFKKCCGA